MMMKDVDRKVIEKSKTSILLSTSESTCMNYLPTLPSNNDR